MTLKCLLFPFLLPLLFSAVKSPSVIICEKHKGTISCPNGKLIDVLNANYGRLDREMCQSPSISCINCRSSNSLKRVQDKCNGKTSCELHVNNSLFSDDPCPGMHKYLEVKYRCLENIILGKRGNDKNVSELCLTLLLQEAMFHDLGSPMLL